MRKKYKVYIQLLKTNYVSILKLNAKKIHINQLQSKIHLVYKNSEIQFLLKELLKRLGDNTSSFNSGVNLLNNLIPV
jgi:hypothetical protein